MKVIIAGGRDFNNYELLKEFCDNILNDNDHEIVSGNAKGADKLGERYSTERNLKLTLFPADWNKYNKAAGMIRNIEMAEYGDMLIAFWDQKSRGTKNMMEGLRELLGPEIQDVKVIETDEEKIKQMDPGTVVNARYKKIIDVDRIESDDVKKDDAYELDDDMFS